MLKLKSIGNWIVPGRGLVLGIEAPVEIEDRTLESVIKTLGNPIEIDGTVYRIRGAEMYMPAPPIHVGEKIGLLVSPYRAEDGKQ